MKKNISILYVDDEEINLQLFEINFRRKFNIFTAQSGKEGLMIIDSNPDIKAVISDMKMPEMDGLDFIEIIKKNYPFVVCFILTGFDITDNISEALKNRIISAYFSKPFDFVEIETAIMAALNEINPL